MLSDQRKRRNSSFGKTLRYIGQQTRPFSLLLGFVLLLVACEVVLVTLMLPNVLEHIINLAEQTPSKYWFNALWRSIRYFLLLQIVIELLVRLENYLLSIRMAPRLRCRLYQQNVTTVLRKEHMFYKRAITGKLSENLVRIADTIPEIVQTFILKCVFFVLSFGCIIYVFYTVDALLALLPLLFFVLLILVLAIFNKRISFISNEWSYKVAMVSGRIVDLLSNIQLIGLFVGRKRERKKLDVMLQQMANKEVGLQRSYLTMFGLIGLGHILLQGSCFYFLLQKGIQGSVSVGQLAVVIYINETLMGLIWYDLPDLALLSIHFGEVEQALEGIEEGKDEEDAPNAQPLRISRGDIVFNKVQFRFDQETPLFFKNINLTIPAKQKVGIVGHAGSGKSTFIKLLLRLYPLDQGNITIDGQDIAKVTRNSLRLGIGVILQNMTLFQRSLWENVNYGNFEASQAAISKALHNAQVYDLVMASIKKDRGSAQPSFRNISGGQQQKINIARLMLKAPPILILDEAMSQLDAVTEHQVQKKLDLLMEDKTTIVIAHRLFTMTKMNRILVFHEGEIVEDGTHHTLLAKKGIYADLWRTQAEGIASNAGKE